MQRRQRRPHIVAAANGRSLDLKYRLRNALARRFKRVDYIDNIDHFSKAIRRISGHCRLAFSVWSDADDALRSSSGHAAFQEMVLAQGLGDADRQAPRDKKGDRGSGTPVGRDPAPHMG